MITIVSNVWSKTITLKEGEVHPGHSHKFDHTHLLAVGEVKITVDGIEKVYKAPTQIVIGKGKDHSMECLSEISVGWCIHAIRDGERIEDIFDPELCPTYLEEEEALKVYPTSQFLD